MPRPAYLPVADLLQICSLLQGLSQQGSRQEAVRAPVIWLLMSVRGNRSEGSSGAALAGSATPEACRLAAAAGAALRTILLGTTCSQLPLRNCSVPVMLQLLALPR